MIEIELVVEPRAVTIQDVRPLLFAGVRRFFDGDGAAVEPLPDRCGNDVQATVRAKPFCSLGQCDVLVGRDQPEKEALMGIEDRSPARTLPCVGCTSPVVRFDVTARLRPPAGRVRAGIRHVHSNVAIDVSFRGRRCAGAYLALSVGGGGAGGEARGRAVGWA